MIDKGAMILGVIAFSLLGASSHAGEDTALRETLAVGKMSGACGILDSMIQFQETTEMPGGDEFVARFWAGEATRLGMTVQEYSDQCDRSLAAYGKLWSFEENTEK